MVISPSTVLTLKDASRTLTNTGYSGAPEGIGGYCAVRGNNVATRLIHEKPHGSEQRVGQDAADEASVSQPTTKRGVA